ncbi:MAG: hypothetical protein NVV62_08035 [Terricaulis sp.]|nr:hypothetical protein [Terricaulis sp.]
MTASEKIVRMAFFEGAFKPGQEAAFHAYARERLVPLWTSFPNLEAFRMLPGGVSDDGAHPFVLILEFTYPSHAALEAALNSPARLESREVTKGLFDYFEGRITHIVAPAQDPALRR